MQEGARQFGIVLSGEKVEKFLAYLKELKSWNEKINLTGIRDEREILIKHFLDSLSIFQVTDENFQKLVDIGPGAGFPSLPLKLSVPSIQCTLIESNKKKTDFLQHIVRYLDLQNVRVIRARAERVAKGEERENFDYAVGRAVAKLNVLLEYTLPFLKIGGYFIAQKGPDIREVEQIQEALSILGGEIIEVRHFKLPFSGSPRSLIVIKKVKLAPSKYPRRPGIPQKRPL